MARIRPFRGLRPTPDKISQVASPPYDVLNSEEARRKAAGNPISFLHVNKPEIDLPEGTDLYSPEVYAKGGENLARLINDGVMVRDAQPCYYVYKLRMGDHEQVGLVAVASVEDYAENIIKKHEFTRPDKENDRMTHIDSLNAQVGPVFLTYRERSDINAIIDRIMQDEPVYDFTGDYNVRHTLYVVGDRAVITQLDTAFAAVEALYVADGHHRSAAAARVRDARKAANPAHTGNESYNYFLSVIFPDKQMNILDYNRVVTDLNGRSPAAFMEAVSERFTVSEAGGAAYAPAALHHFGMYLNGVWYRLEAKRGSFDAGDPIKQLDVSILQENLLKPVLGIENPRTDKRINFVGGIRGLGELERLVDSGDFSVAFSLHPTTIDQLLAVADANEVMPPKSTWFEPKLASGVVVHVLD
ncbi:DUF1015 domain-containing protein [bacterium]|nr:DUF1015 domain-containing protein [bacterium]